MMTTPMKVRFIADSHGDIEGLYKSYGIDLNGVYEVVGYGDKLLLKVGKRLIDVYPSRVEIVE